MRKCKTGFDVVLGQVDCRRAHAEFDSNDLISILDNIHVGKHHGKGQFCLVHGTALRLNPSRRCVLRCVLTPWFEDTPQSALTLFPVEVLQGIECVQYTCDWGCSVAVFLSTILPVLGHS